jgi:hypothetical protein
MILGVTLSLVGTSATSLGLVVGAMTPAGRVKHMPILRSAHRKYSFDTAAIVAASLFAAGVLVDAFVLAYWLYHDRGVLTLLFTRLTLFGLLLIAMAVQIAVSALLLGTTYTGSGISRGDASARSAAAVSS